MRKFMVLAAMAAVVAALGLLPAGQTSASHLADGLVAYWAFDDGASPTADVAHGNNGTITGATYTGGGVNAAPVPGNVDALNFDSSGPDLVRVLDDPDLEPANVTVSAWVRAGASPGSARYMVVKGAQGCQSGSYALYTGGGGARFYIRDAGGFILGPSVTTAAIWDGSWHHLAGTYDGATLRMYLDGTEVAGAVASATTIAYGLATNDDLLVGQYGGTCSLPFSGDIDEVRIYDQALTAAEVAALADYSTFSVSLSPASDINPIGAPHTVTATLSPALSFIPVLFKVTGANPQAATANTDGSGQASSTYTGTSAGTDTVTACIDLDDSGTCDGGEPADAVTKTWYDKFVSGGGQLLETSPDTKRPDWHVISFGGFAASAGASGFIGEWQVNFHNVGFDDTYDKSKFHTTSIDDMVFVFDGGDCEAGVRFYATGEWNGIPDYEMIFRAEDAGEPGSSDNVRIELYDPDGIKVYDTDFLWQGEFTNQSVCWGMHRTLLDNGNLQIADLTVP